MAEAEAWVMIPKVKNKGTECVLDMKPIVLCKDCEHYYEGNCRNGETIYWKRDPEWFCADGKRKDDD